MKNYKRLMMIIFLLFACIWVVANILFIQKNKTEDRSFMVEISRTATKMEDDWKAADSPEDVQTDYAQYIEDSRYIKKIILCDTEEKLTENSRYSYCIKSIAGALYRFEYDDSMANTNIQLYVINIIFCVALIFLIVILSYVYRKIIRPFSALENVPYELSKGNLTLQLPEEKAKYFGKFIWGTNMLRENIEERRKKELDLHREKKLLLLSLTHDIKTPLSVIKLNTQALEKGLYKEEDRKQAALLAIRDKVDEIERYVSEISKASKEDFLDLQVKEEEFYLSAVIEYIRNYYKDKMELQKTQFTIEEYKDCLLSGDENRLVEVLQNLMENAVKYGDGKEINIRFAKEEDCYLITVENSGKEIPKEECLKLFDSFFRGSNVKTQSGSGLGLYICRQLMSGMNGDIFVKQKENYFQMTLVVRMCGV